MGLIYMLMFPSKRKVLHAGKSYFFATPQAAWDWVRKNLHISRGLVPPWGSTDTSEIGGLGGRAPKGYRQRCSRSWRKWEADQRARANHSLEDEMYTDATDSMGPDLQASVTVGPCT